MTARQNAVQIFSAAVAAVQPAKLIPDHLFIDDTVLHIFDQQFLIGSINNIYVIGAGKASAAMAKTTEEILGNLIATGIVVTKYRHCLPLQKIVCLEAAHPVPDENGITATAEIVKLLQKAGENDIVICLISGGASSLWIDIPQAAALRDIQQSFELLLKSGADIYEINTVRKHLSALKGGQLLSHAPQASFFSFIISDVPGDNLSVIASGPTMPDSTTFEDANSILKKYNLLSRLPDAIIAHINNGIKGTIKDTPKTGDSVFKNSYNKIIGSNSIALESARVKAIELGYHIGSVSNNLNGDASIVGRELVKEGRQYSGSKPACFLFGGETTVIVTGNGKGGRNQQMVLSAYLELNSTGEKAGTNKITFLSAGTDGTDGPTDAAGAIADNYTILLPNEIKLQAEAYLEKNNAYHFFEQTGGLIKTGPTQTNVMDIVVMIIENN